LSEKQKVNGDIELFKNGDSEFFETLYITYFEKLCAYALNYISDKEAIQDLVQDVFINLWTHRKKIIITTSLNSYMYKIVYNKIMDAHRNAKKKKRRSFFLLQRCT
jgi:DNA-directed RNA polymerase specialized sigma subunit, sigma24 homolog